MVNEGSADESVGCGRRIYIAGPIAGRVDGNREAFRHRAGLLRAHGFEPVNPHDVDHSHEGPCIGDPTDRPEDEHRYGCYLRADIDVLMRCDGYTVLNDWSFSRGARVERHVAFTIGLPLLIFGANGDLLREQPRGRQLPIAEALVPSIADVKPLNPETLATLQGGPVMRAKLDLDRISPQTMSDLAEVSPGTARAIEEARRTATAALRADRAKAVAYPEPSGFRSSAYTIDHNESGNANVSPRQLQHPAMDCFDGGPLSTVDDTVGGETDT